MSALTVRAPYIQQWPGQKIGLYGGTFNPAHLGHLQLAQTALRQLRLDGIWWLVSPNNPLKSTENRSRLKKRLRAARKLAAHNRRIKVLKLEKNLRSTYTFDTLTQVKHLYPNHRFVWLMGADNLAQLPKWHRWQELVQLVPMAVFARPPYSFRALAGPAARRLAKYQLPMRMAGKLVDRKPPAWVMVWSLHNPLSSTQIRDKKGRV